MTAEDGWTDAEMDIVERVASRLRGDYHDDMTDPNAIIVAGWVLIVWDFVQPYKVQFYNPDDDTLAPCQVVGSDIDAIMVSARAWATVNPAAGEWLAAASRTAMEVDPCA